MLSSKELQEGDLVEIDVKKSGHRNGFLNVSACRTVEPPYYDIPSTTPCIVLKVIPPHMRSSHYYAVIMQCQGVIFTYVTAAHPQRIWRRIE